MTSVTSRQVDKILWRAVRQLHARAGRCLKCRKQDPTGPKPCPHSLPIDGELHELARSGLIARDFREITGFTAKESEAVAGISGANLLYILDEASGIPEQIYEAVEGNRAGGARVVLFSNPTRTEGEFYEAFNAKADFYKTITVSSEESPNVKAGRVVIPGLAVKDYIEEKKREWGEDSALYKIRIKGEFVTREDGKILSVHLLSEAEARWEETAAEGRLVIGIDPAGPGRGGDASAFAIRRGLKVVAVLALQGLNEGAHLANLLQLLRDERKPGEESPLVVIDREGPVGMAVWGTLRTHVQTHPDDFELRGVRSSDKAVNQPDIYGTVRDELWACAAEFIKDGGAIPRETKLSKELHAPEWIGQANGKLKATPKDDLRKMLGRSPDRADAVCLAVWNQSRSSDTYDYEAATPPPMPGSPDPYHHPMGDSYSALDIWRQR